MRRLLAFVVALVLLPAAAAAGADLEELLQRSQDASYTAEQLIACNTPDGVRDALLKLSQQDGEIVVESQVEPGVVVSTGAGGWTVTRQGALVSSASVPPEEHVAESRYELEDGEPVVYLGREATSYAMVGEGMIRAELVFDDEVGALLRVATFTDDGDVYCERRFISFDPTAAPSAEVSAPVETDPSTLGTPSEADLPGELSGFELLDVYQDPQGFTFAYYSDGFFSFAVFHTPVRIEADEAVPVDLGGRYLRSFGAGQVTYAWETQDGGMALVGDLPPDMHHEVLTTLPPPQDPGLLRRLWRSLFG